MLSLYRAVMDPEVNPLRNLPAAQRFQLMLALSIMWTIVFCAGSGAWMWYGELLILHLLLAAATLVTGFTFRRASQVRIYRDCPAKDGTARYDDVWGG